MPFEVKACSIDEMQRHPTFADRTQAKVKVVLREIRAREAFDHNLTLRVWAKHCNDQHEPAGSEDRAAGQGRRDPQAHRSRLPRSRVSGDGRDNAAGGSAARARLRALNSSCRVPPRAAGVAVSGAGACDLPAPPARILPARGRGRDCASGAEGSPRALRRLHTSVRDGGPALETARSRWRWGPYPPPHALNAELLPPRQHHELRDHPGRS